ncbi:MAG: hypothetical protein NTZ14_16375 [Hyphomicrobiales bacterium]|nr:hypothetical protein [Hyphomicrobiales bacterium]
MSLLDVATETARDVAAPGGALTTVEIVRIEGTERHEQHFVRLMAVRRYWRTYDRALRAEADDCLGAAVANDPGLEAGRAAIALLSIERAREAQCDQRSQLLAVAQAQLASATGAGLLGDDARLALVAGAGDMDGVRSAADKLIQRYPNNPDVLADVGSKLGLVLGDWPPALEAEARAIALDPAPDPCCALAILAKAALDGEPERAKHLLSQAPQCAFPAGQVIRLAIGGAAGDISLASDARARLAAMDIRDTQTMLRTIDGQCWSEDVKRAFKRGIEAANG